VCTGGRGRAFVKRLIGRPGDRIHEDARGFLWLNGRKLDEPYVTPARRAEDIGFLNRSWRVPEDAYFMVGDNRGGSCDSRAWGPVPRRNLIGEVFATYWPPGRISTNLVATCGLLAALVVALAAYRSRHSTSAVACYYRPRRNPPPK
jgi:type IV secretory pathway protease TraF